MNKQPVYYMQTDQKWKNKAWNGMTLGVAGCGPTCAAMLISTLTGKDVTPDKTYAWAGANGHLAKGYGTNYGSYFQEQFAQYGIKAEMLNWTNTYGKPYHPNHDKVVEKLKQGYYAIALMREGLWTTGGHFIVVWWNDNKVRINDPASKRPERLNGDIQTFRSQVRYYWLIDAREYNNNKEDEDMTGKEIYDRLVEYLSTQPVPDWAKDEYAATIDKGITDGTRPMMFTSRLETAIMAKRAVEKE